MTKTYMPVMPATDDPELFPQLTEDEQRFLLAEPDEVQKRFTGASLRKIQIVREALAMLVVAWPVKEIAHRLHLSEGTLRAFIANEGEKVAASAKELTAILRSKALRWLALAQTREQEAPYRDLVMGAKLALDAANQAEQTGLVGEEKTVKEDRNRLDGVERLRRLLAEALPHLVAPGGDLVQEALPAPRPAGTDGRDGTTDGSSAASTHNDKHLRSCRADDGAVNPSVTSDAAGPTTDQAGDLGATGAGGPDGRMGGGGVRRRGAASRIRRVLNREDFMQGGRLTKPVLPHRRARQGTTYLLQQQAHQNYEKRRLTTYEPGGVHGGMEGQAAHQSRPKTGAAGPGGLRQSQGLVLSERRHHRGDGADERAQHGARAAVAVAK